MSKRILNEAEIKMLNENKNVLRVTSKIITYTPEFKVYAIKENLAGKLPKEIFIESGFDLKIIGKDQPSRCLARWRRKYRLLGEEGLRRVYKGEGSTGCPKKSKLTEGEQLVKAQARIKYLEAELEFLKKLEALERQVKQK